MRPPAVRRAVVGAAAGLRLPRERRLAKAMALGVFAAKKEGRGYPNAKAPPSIAKFRTDLALDRADRALMRIQKLLEWGFPPRAIPNARSPRNLDGKMVSFCL